MAASQTTRLAVYTWTAGTDTFTRDQMTTSHNNIEARVAGYNQAASRPAASTAYKGFVHYSSTDSSAGTLSYCNGTAWFNIGSLGSTTPTALDGSGSAGSGQDAARSDHKHAIANDAITNAMIATDAVQSDQIQAAAVTDAKLASSGLDISKFTTGNLDAGRITSNSIAHAKLANSAGFTVLGKGTTGSGSFTELTAGNNGVLRRSGSGNLEFDTLVTGNIGAGQITDTLLKQTDGSEAVTTDTIRAGAVGETELAAGAVTLAKLVDASAGYSIIAKVGTGTGDFGQLAAGTNSVLLRDGSDDLEFAKIDRYHIATNADIQATQLANAQITDTQLDLDQCSFYGKSGVAKDGHEITISSSAPASNSVGENGDIWFQYA